MRYIVCSLILITVFSCSEKSTETCRIEGTVIDRDSKALVIQKAHEGTYPNYLDADYDYIRIPIVDNSFTYEFEFDVDVAYKLIFEEELERSWMPIEFFPVDGTIEMTLYPRTRQKENQFVGSELTNEFNEIENSLQSQLSDVLKTLYDSLEVLKMKDMYFSDTMKTYMVQHEMNDEYDHKGDRNLYNELTMLAESGVAYSALAKAVNQQISSERRQNRMELYDIIDMRSDIVSYYLLIHRLRYFDPNTDDKSKLASLQENLSSKFEDHPYNEISEEIIWSTENMVAGGDYHDFVLPDLNQELHTLSDEINDEYSLLLIWAPWCAPCIKSNREMVPIYKKYKDKGLKAVAVVGRFKAREHAEKIIAQEDNPWLHLIDDEWYSSVWSNYGLYGSGGSIFLIDNEGKIMSVYPGAEEVDQILSSVLN